MTKLDGGHFYPVDTTGTVYPSVTTIISNTLDEPPELKRWKLNNRNWKNILQHRATLGSLVHFRILNALSETRIDLPDEPMDTWSDDMEEKVEIATHMFYKLNLKFDYPRFIEFLLVNDRYKYAGRCDCLAPIDIGDGKGYIQTLGDLKTSREARLSHMLQMGGYYDAIPTNRKPERAVLICIHPFEENNPYLEGHLHIINKHELLKFRDQFRELATQFHEKYDYTEFTPNQHGKGRI